MNFKSALAALALASLPITAHAGELQNNWAGFYAGVNGGYSFGDFRDEVYDGYYGNKVEGASFGAQIGYNFVSDNTVFGVELEGDLANVSGSNPNYESWDQAYYKDKSISVLGRLGVHLGSYMPYTTAGYSYAALSDKANDADANQSGLTVGFGTEMALDGKLVARIEYRYTDFGTIPETNVGWYELQVTDTTIRAGLSYHFD